MDDLGTAQINFVIAVARKRVSDTLILMIGVGEEENSLAPAIIVLFLGAWYDSHMHRNCLFLKAACQWRALAVA